MVNQAQVDELTRELESLRGLVVRKSHTVNERVNRLLRDAHRLRLESEGTSFEPCLQSVENLIACLKRGMSSQSELRPCASLAS